MNAAGDDEVRRALESEAGRRFREVIVRSWRRQLAEAAAPEQERKAS